MKVCERGRVCCDTMKEMPLGLIGYLFEIGGDICEYLSSSCTQYIINAGFESCSGLFGSLAKYIYQQLVITSLYTEITL